MKALLGFTVFGVPVPQGSKRGFINRKSGRVQLVEANLKTIPWRGMVSIAARAAWAIKRHVICDPVRVTAVFYFPYRKSDLKKDGTPKRDGVVYKCSKPDLDKLLRAIFDGITDAGAWRDDSLVAEVAAKKTYSSRPRVEVRVEQIGMEAL